MVPAWRRNKPLREPAAPARSHAPPDLRTPTMKWLQWLVWSYFWLLLVEGALRKWFLPGLSTPLLIIRDPVVIVIYVLAAQASLFPRNGFLTAVIALAAATMMLGMIQVATGVTTIPVMVYGLRTNFLHLPLIFLLPRIFNHNDVCRLGRWVLILMVPMAMLMVAQFRAPREAWINAAIGDGLQLEAAYGKIRPAATFSFVTGVVAFTSLAAAFLLHGLATRKQYSPVLLTAAGLGLAGALAVSGSRSAVLVSAIVCICFFTASLLAGRAATGLVRFGIVAGVVAIVASTTSFLDEGLTILTARWEMAAEHEKATGGMAGRWFGEILEPVRILFNVPFLGLGLGRGTNVGAQLITGIPNQFLLSETEWSRVLCESGPVLGVGYIVLRMVLTAWLGLNSWRAAQAGNTLPMLLFGAGAISLFNGQFGPATQLGFAVLTAGLALAADQHAEPSVVTTTTPVPDGAIPGKPRRPFRKPTLKPPVQESPST